MSGFDALSDHDSYEPIIMTRFTRETGVRGQAWACSRSHGSFNTVLPLNLAFRKSEKGVLRRKSCFITQIIHLLTAIDSSSQNSNWKVCGLDWVKCGSDRDPALEKSDEFKWETEIIMSETAVILSTEMRFAQTICRSSLSDEMWNVLNKTDSNNEVRGAIYAAESLKLSECKVPDLTFTI
jgi:hypothetical protein